MYAVHVHKKCNYLHLFIYYEDQVVKLIYLSVIYYINIRHKMAYRFYYKCNDSSPRFIDLLHFWPSFFLSSTCTKFYYNWFCFILSWSTVLLKGVLYYPSLKGQFFYNWFYFILSWKDSFITTGYVLYFPKGTFFCDINILCL